MRTGTSRSQRTQAGVQLSQHLRETSETAPHPVQLLGGCSCPSQGPKAIQPDPHPCSSPQNPQPHLIPTIAAAGFWAFPFTLPAAHAWEPSPLLREVKDALKFTQMRSSRNTLQLPPFPASNLHTYTLLQAAEFCRFLSNIPVQLVLGSRNHVNVKARGGQDISQGSEEPQATREAGEETAVRV